MLRAGLVGLGMMGRHHMRLLNQIDNVQFVGLHDPALVGQDTVDGHRVFNSFEELITQDLDYCYLL